MIESPGTFGQTLSFGEGSKLSSDGISSSGSLHFELDAVNILSLPIATIDITSVDGSSPLATVFFNTDSRLNFTYAGSSSPITSSQVESILNDPGVVAGLLGPAGTSSDLPLFHFTMDLTTTTLSSDAGFGSMGLAQAAGAVPETSSFLLVAFGLAAFAVPCVKRTQLSAK